MTTIDYLYFLMKRLLATLLLLITGVGFVYSQIVSTNPILPKADQPVTITVDVSGTSLDKFAWDNTSNPVYIWTWLKNSSGPDIDAPTNVNPATSPGQDAAKCTRIGTNPDKYQITFTPTVFFNKSAAQITRVGLKLKSRNWNDNKQTDNDRFFDIAVGFDLIFSQPTVPFLFKNQSESFDITANTTNPADIILKIGGITVKTVSQVAVLNYTHTVTESSGTIPVVCEATGLSQTKSISFAYTVRSPVVLQSRPSGVVDGINYSTDGSKVTLSLWAPGKSSAYVIGDFTNWDVNAAYQMKKDGEHFWLDVTGLTPGTEYGFQYLVDESLRMADPYADKILDPDDQFIPASTYPSLKIFPQKALSDKWYFNRVAVLQTNQVPYQWQTTTFQKPAKEKLVIYELLIRDFFGSGGRNYQNLIDTLSYFKRLGINAIELMPVTEFNGNDSWGYNPTFMFAPDKYYGTKNKLKEFIDKCHQKGIAVILDIVMNHQDLPNPYVMMDFNFTNFAPTPANKWFNQQATHPYSVFYDLNHESTYTKKYLDTVNYYWLNEYKVDGYRYDLSKGFTQTSNPTNVSAWGAYDPSRISILKRMADKIWSHTPGAYVILEHFADNPEEKELAEYRSPEGKGMMLWGNFGNAYNQSTMGYSSDSDFSSIYFANKSWTVPGIVGYMESHDEERLMYKNLQYGNHNTDYNVKSIGTALARMEAANVVFYTIPGPKMLWQFGELGYDFSINICADGTLNSNCRVSAKPVKWNYLQDPFRKHLLTHTSDLIRLRNTYSVFTSGTATILGGLSLLKQVQLKNKPYTESPATATQMNVVAVANFDIVNQSAPVSFPHTGTWYDYYSYGAVVNVTTAPFSIDLLPGRYKLFTDVQITNPIVTGVGEETDPVLKLYPNPVQKTLFAEVGNDPIEELSLRSLLGARINPARLDSNSWDVTNIASGLYVVEIRTSSSTYRKKIVKN